MATDSLQAGRHGTLNPRAGEGTYSLTRHEPSPRLAPWVELYWEVRWDQSHFIREFKAQVGRTPADYAARCAASIESRKGLDSP